MSSSENEYIEIYNEEQYKRDKANFEKAEKYEEKLDFNGFKRLLTRDLCLNNIYNERIIDGIRIEDVKHALKHPVRNWKTLLCVSEKLMRISPYYYRLNMMLGNMMIFCWGLDLYDVKSNANIETMKNGYYQLASRLEKMNLKHEFSKIAKSLPYQDIFCGLVVENNNDYFIQQLDFRVCKLYKVQDGIFNFAIDLSKISGSKLSAYPDYVQEAYIKYYDGLIDNLYEPDYDKQICIKLNNQWLYPYPMMIGLVSDILDLDVYKKLKLQSARTDNYKAIMIQVPIDKSKIDKPLLTPGTLGIFAEINKENMPDDIGLIHTLGEEAEAINFKDSSNSRNNVADAVDDIYNSSGISKELYNGSSSGTALTLSVENDSSFAYGVYRQMERWVNRIIKNSKYNKSTYKFKFYLLDATIYNRDTVCKRYKDAVTLGATVIDKWMALLDMTPSTMLGSYITHNYIYDFQNNFKALNSSYNSSGNDNAAGRPTNADKGELLSESGEQTQDNDSNSKR